MKSSKSKWEKLFFLFLGLAIIITLTFCIIASFVDGSNLQGNELVEDFGHYWFYAALSCALGAVISLINYQKHK